MTHTDGSRPRTGGGPVVWNWCCQQRTRRVPHHFCVPHPSLPGQTAMKSKKTSNDICFPIFFIVNSSRICFHNNGMSILHVIIHYVFIDDIYLFTGVGAASDNMLGEELPLCHDVCISSGPHCLPFPTFGLLPHDFADRGPHVLVVLAALGTCNDQRNGDIIRLIIVRIYKICVADITILKCFRYEFSNTCFVVLMCSLLFTGIYTVIFTKTITFCF